MNKKNIFVVCTAVSALLIGAVSFAVSKKSISRLSAANGKYTMTLNENNGPELTNTPSNGNFTVNTVAGNAIQFNYSGLSAGSGLVGKISQWGNISNATPITGMVSVVATFTGTLKVNYGLTTSEAHGEYLTSGAELEFPLTACYIELKAFTAVDLSSLTVKYDCALSEEGENARAIEAKRFELLSVFDYPTEEYRSEEINTLSEIAAPILHDIRDESATLAELNAIDVTPFTDALAAAKTNAALMVEEAYKYRHLSEWDLVNAHAYNYVATPSTFKTNGLGGDDVGYITSPGTYQGGFEAVIKCNNTAGSAKDFGIIIGNDSPSGDGLDGYMVAWNYTAGDHMYLQVFKLVNGYGSATISFDYIGGWIYDRGTLDLRNDEIRVAYNGYYITLMNEQDYQNNVNYAIVIDLNYNGYSLDPNASYQFTYANWDGTSANSLQIKKLIMDSAVDSNAIANEIANEQVAKYNSSIYEQEEQDLFDAKIAEIGALRSAGTYAAIMAKVDEFIELLNTLKTHDQKEIERHQDISVQILDNIYSGDPTKYTASNWDLVNEHALAWTHVAGSHTVVTDGLAGYCMDAAVHTNFTVVFKVTGTQATNPYNASWPGSALIIGGNVSGQYFTGIEVVLSQGADFGFQLYTSMTGANSDPGCYADQFIGGNAAANAEGVTYRLTVNNGVLTVFVINTTTGEETQMGGVDGGFAGVTQWNVGNLSGHFGIMDWDGATTYEILEFKDL